MIFAFMILFVLAAALFGVALRRGNGLPQKAIRTGARMLAKAAPLLLLAFVISGMLQAAVPPATIRQWLGTQAGLKGVLIGGVCGAMISGGPYVAFPIIAAVYKAGAGISTIIAFVTGWAMLGVAKVPFELALMGTRFTVARIALFGAFPFVAGWVAYLVL